METLRPLGSVDILGAQIIYNQVLLNKSVLAFKDLHVFEIAAQLINMFGDIGLFSLE